MFLNKKKNKKLTKKEALITKEMIKLFYKTMDFFIGVLIGCLATFFLLVIYITFLVSFNNLALFLFSSFVLISNALSYLLGGKISNINI